MVFQIIRKISASPFLPGEKKDEKFAWKNFSPRDYSEESENYWGGVLSNSIVKCFLSVPSGVESVFNEPNRKFGNFAGKRNQRWIKSGISRKTYYWNDSFKLKDLFYVK